MLRLPPAASILPCQSYFLSPDDDAAAAAAAKPRRRGDAAPPTATSSFFSLAPFWALHPFRDQLYRSIARGGFSALTAGSEARSAPPSGPKPLPTCLPHSQATCRLGIGSGAPLRPCCPTPTGRGRPPHLHIPAPLAGLGGLAQFLLHLLNRFNLGGSMQQEGGGTGWIPPSQTPVQSTGAESNCIPHFFAFTD